MPKIPDHNTGALPDTANALPVTFADIAERWNDLIYCQRALALGRLWETKKAVTGPNGEKFGLTEKEFIRRTAAIVGEDREVISALFMEYRANHPDPELPPKRAKRPEIDTPKIPLDDRIMTSKPQKPNGKSGRPRKKSDSPKKTFQIRPVPKEVIERFTKQPSLTPEQIREINRKMNKKLGKIGVL